MVRATSEELNREAVDDFGKVSFRGGSYPSAAAGKKAGRRPDGLPLDL